MNIDWNSPEVVRAWSRAVGGKSAPFGDAWRVALVNPAIAQIAGLVAARKREAERAAAFPEETPIYAGLLRQREEAGEEGGAPELDKLQKWHRSESCVPGGCGGLTVLDLGCGEGYLGRWLASRAAEYVGVDASRDLIGEARRRAGGRQRFVVADLNGRAFDGTQMVESLRLKEPPDLTVGIVVLDHLEEPAPLLSWLGQYLAPKWRDAAFLLFTLNRDYFDCSEDPSRLRRTERAFGERTEQIRARIASAETDVDVYLRSRRTIEGLLRDARMRIAGFAPLEFGKALSRANAKEPEGIRGIPPFHAFLCRPFPPATRDRGAVEALEAMLGGESGSILARFSNDQKAYLRSMAARMDVTTYPPGSIALAPHNLGGDLFVVLAGGLELTIPKLPEEINEEDPPGGSTIRTWTGQVFGRGDLLGDLETGERGRSGYYPYPVLAGESGATVLRIPADVAAAVLQLHPCGGTSLFSMLRDRLIVSIWSYNHRDRGGKTIEMPEDVSRSLGFQPGRRPRLPLPDETTHRELDRVGRILLAAAETERQSGTRDPDGNSVFMSSDELVRRTRLAIRNRNPIYGALRVLVQLRIVDAYSGESLRTREELRTEIERTWLDLVKKAGAAILLPACPGGRPGFDRYLAASLESLNLTPPPSTGADDKKRLGVGSLGATSDGAGWSKSARALHGGLMERFSGEEWERAVESWMAFLWGMNRFWYDKGPTFFYIHDLHALRALALDDYEKVSADLACRWRTLWRGTNEVEKLPRLASKAGNGRLRLYLRRVSEFFENDLRSCGGRLAFSNAPDGKGYPLPPFPET